MVTRGTVVSASPLIVVAGTVNVTVTLLAPLSPAFSVRSSTDTGALTEAACSMEMSSSDSLNIIASLTDWKPK